MDLWEKLVKNFLNVWVKWMKKPLCLDEALFRVGSADSKVDIEFTNPGTILWKYLLWIRNYFLCNFYYVVIKCPFLWRYPSPPCSPNPSSYFLEQFWFLLVHLIFFWRKLAKEKWVSLPSKTACFCISLYRVAIVSKPKITIKEYTKNTE